LTRFLGKEGFLYFGVLAHVLGAQGRRMFPRSSYGQIGMHLSIGLERGVMPKDG